MAWETSPQLQYTFLTMFINHCQNVYDDLQKIEKRFLRGTITTYERTPGGNDVVVAILRDMKEHILQAGFYYLFSDNPNVQYGTARYRITSRPVDRVYAIMQIYDLCVGKSARPDKNPKLDELKDEFAAAINHHCIILGQILLHTDSPDLGKTWRITEFSTIPDKLMDYKDPNRLATIRHHADKLSSGVRVSGKCCELDELMTISAKVGAREGRWSRHGWGLHFEVLFDHHIHGAITTRPSYQTQLSEE